MCKNARNSKTRRQSKPDRRSRSLTLESLEDRQVLSTFVVTSTGDDHLAAGAMFANPVAGSSDTYQVSSLRAAVEAANQHAGADSITFAASLSKQTIVLLNGRLQLTDTSGKTTIAGKDAKRLTIDGKDASRVFQIGSGVSVAMSDLTIAHGKSTSDGGGIGNYGSLELSNCTLLNNSAVTGGGISNFGTLTIVNSTLTANTASKGGGIYNAGAMTVTNSTLARNVSANAGAGIANAGKAALYNTIVAADANASGAAVADLTAFSGASYTFANCLIQRPGNAAISNGSNGNITGQDPRLDALRDNGGTTSTMALLTGSAARDAGCNAHASDVNGNSLTKDQRGSLRISNATVDIGAWEGPSPTGIYCSGPYTHQDGTITVHSVEPNLNTLGYVDGALLRVAWKDLEPSPGVYNWSLIDNELARAEAQGIKVTLDVLNGYQAPSWLASQSGMQEFKYNFQGKAVQMPVPWNQTYLSFWTRLISQLGQRYDGNSTISLVHMSNSTKNGFEMQLPNDTADMKQWKAIGYTSQKEIASWKTVLDAYRTAFKTKPLDVEVHPVLGEDTVAQQTVAYGQSTIGARFGVFAAWWSQHNSSVYAGMYNLLKQAAATSFATVQMVTNATNYPNGFGSGGIQGAIDLARSIGVKYFEIWDTDLWNRQFASMFQNLDTEISGSTTLQAATTSSTTQFTLASAVPQETTLGTASTTASLATTGGMFSEPPAKAALPASVVDAVWQASLLDRAASSQGNREPGDVSQLDVTLKPALKGRLIDSVLGLWAW